MYEVKFPRLPGPMAGCELPPDWLVDNVPDLKSRRVWFGVDPAGHSADAMGYAFVRFPHKSKLEQIIEEGLSRMDKAVNRVCDRYDGMREEHPGLVVFKEIARAVNAFKKDNFSGPHFAWMRAPQHHDLLNFWYATGLLKYQASLIEMPPRIHGVCIKYHYDEYIKVT